MTRLSIVSAVFTSLLFSHIAVAAPVKACSYMTPQTASAALGSPVGTGEEQTLPMASEQCVFSHEDPAAPCEITFGVGDINTMAAGVGASAATVLPIIKDAAHGQTNETIPSLGEWNAYAWNGLTDYTLTVIYHGKVLTLGTSGVKNPNLKAALVQTMRQIMQKF
jgi:hypothetical protein